MLPQFENFAALGIAGFAENKQAINRKFGQMASMVTEAADRNIPLAVRVCGSAADTAVVGISCWHPVSISPQCP
ncbi:hypothetical protein Q0F98_30810 [Paenibacillus amylolyticus]|nr:hypothetical protein Q0F98_30810 [Paenibacillus amylolyticus]